MTSRPAREPDHSDWPPFLRFCWEILGDPKRLAAIAVLLVIAIVTAKGAYAGLYHDMTRYLHGGATIAIFGGAGTGTPVFALLFTAYRKWRARRRKPLPRKRAAKPVAQAPDQNRDNNLGEPGEV